MTTTYHLLDFAPDGTTHVLEYTETEMKEIFTTDQRIAMAEGMRVIHRWLPRATQNHAICDMVVTAKQRWEV